MTSKKSAFNKAATAARGNKSLKPAKKTKLAQLEAMLRRPAGATIEQLSKALDWQAHSVRKLPNGQTQLYVGLHLVHEVTSPQAFEELKARGLKVAAPERTFATLDHIVPTLDQRRPFLDVMAEDMLSALERNCRAHGIRLLHLDSGQQGIVHVIGPELGLTQPGMTIACGDSHTSTHGAFGSLAHGIGTSEVEHVLATQTLIQKKAKNMRVTVDGKLPAGVGPKDVILAIIGKIGTAGGTGYVIEYTGSVIHELSMEGRMTLCNMSIEGGARAGMVAPDEKTIARVSLELGSRAIVRTFEGWIGGLRRKGHASRCQHVDRQSRRGTCRDG